MITIKYFGNGAMVSKGSYHELEVVALVAHKVDKQGDAVTLEELQKAATFFLNHSRNIKLNHAGMDLSHEDIEVSESYIRGSEWRVKLVIKSEDLFKELQRSGVSGASIGGNASATQKGGTRWLHDLRIDELSVLTGSMTPCVPGARVLSLKSETVLSKQETEAKLKEIVTAMQEVRSLLAAKEPLKPADTRSWAEREQDEEREARLRERTSGSRYASQQEHIRDYKYNSRFMPH